MTTTSPAEAGQATAYDIAGRLLEVCNCDAICPCWVGLDPDNGTCDAILAYAVDHGTVRGVDVSNRIIGMSSHIPGNVLAGNWKVVVYVDDRCDDAQQEALISVFTGQLGGPLADIAALVGEIVSVERVPIVCTVEEGRGVLKFGDTALAELEPFTGATGNVTTLSDTIFSTIPGSPAYPGRATTFRRDESRHGLADVDVSGKNALQGDFHFVG